MPSLRLPAFLASDPLRPWIVAWSGAVGGLHLLGAGPWRDTAWGVHMYAFLPGGALGLGLGVLALGFAAGHLRRDARTGPGPTGLSLSWGAILFLVTVAVAWTLRVRHGFLGDGFSAMIELPRGLDFHPRQPLTAVVHRLAYDALAGPLGLDGASPGPRALLVPGAVSALFGGVFAVGAVGLARELVPGRIEARLAAAVLVTQGYVLLFLGYPESYAPLAAGLALFLWWTLRFLRTGRGLGRALGVLAVTVAFHLSAAALLPAAAVACAVALRRDPGSAARGLAAGLVAAAAVTALVALLSRWSDRAPGTYWLPLALFDVARTALSGSEEAVYNPGYRFSLRHARDFLNELVLVGPWGLALFLPAALARGRRWDARAAVLAAAGATCLAVAVLTGDSNLGYARNWDLPASWGVVFTAAGLGLWRSREGRGPAVGALALVLAVSLFHTAPWVAVNASAERGRERFAALPLGGGRVEATLSTWYWNTRDADGAVEWARRAIRANPSSHIGYRNLAAVARLRGNPREAARNLEQAVRLRPDRADYRRMLVEAYEALALELRDSAPREARACLERARDVAEDPRARERLSRILDTLPAPASPRKDRP